MITTSFNSNKNTRALDVFKLLMAICVVANHTNPLVKMQGTFIFRLYESIVYIAVPFFFITTGYLLEQRIKRSDALAIDTLVERLKKIFKCYLLWNIVYLPLVLSYYATNSYSWGHNFLNYIKGLFFVGQHYNDWILWYLLSSVYAFVFLIICEKLRFKRYSVFVISLLIGSFAIVITLFSKGHIIIPNVFYNFFKIMKTLFGSGRIFTGIFYISYGMLLYNYKLHKKESLLLFILGILIQSTSVGVGFVYETGRCICATGLFYLALNMNVENISVEKTLLFRSMSTTIYYIHLWVWSVLYTIVWHKKTDGFIPFILTLGATVFISLIYESLKNRKTNVTK